MQEELKEIEILTFIYKMLKEKAEPRVNKNGTAVYKCSDSNLFELYVEILEDDGRRRFESDEELWIGEKRIDNATLKLIKEQLKEPEPFYCQAGDVCDKQCSTCFSKEL